MSPRSAGEDKMSEKLPVLKIKTLKIEKEKQGKKYENLSVRDRETARHTDRQTDS
jgi:hypothetical protein